ncbi:MAG: segregation/condensation protein A [Planctomycetia bacterium]|nr:segregation/condensation protein A [Planctomycetia bacterium]
MYHVALNMHHGPMDLLLYTIEKEVDGKLVNMFQGPLDFLLALVRNHELDILDVPMVTIIDRYREMIDILTTLNIEEVGEFLVLASTLVEIKSFQVLPTEEEVEVELEDPRKELVRQLLAYKKFCENAGELEERSRLWQRRYPRLANDLAPKSRNLAEEPIEEVELWDLVSAFGRIMREKTPVLKHTVTYDETPISVYMQRIYYRLKREQKVEFTSLFQKADQKSVLIGIFLAVLELVRHEFACVRQQELFGELEIEYREGSKTLDFASMDFNQTGAA